MKYIAVVASLIPLATLGAHAQTSTPCVPHAGPSLVRPIYSTHTTPPFPVLAQKIGEEGTTLLAVAIGPDGAPTAVTVAKSSGSVRLDASAAAYVKVYWKWEPPLGSDCSAVSTSTRVSVMWNLKEFNRPLAKYTEIDMPLSDFPPGAVERKEQGFGSLRVEQSPNDGSTKVSMAESTGYPDLDEKSLEIVRKRFQKAVEGKSTIEDMPLGVVVVWVLPLPHIK